MILLDTHALIWWVADTGRLSRTAEAAIIEHQPLLVSPISFWEIVTLATRGKIELDRDPVRWTGDLLSSRTVQVADLTPFVAIVAAQLPGFQGDLADRLIYATAREMDVPLVTKDAKMREYAQQHRDVGVVW